MNGCHGYIVYWQYGCVYFIVCLCVCPFIVCVCATYVSGKSRDCLYIIYVIM